MIFAIVFTPLVSIAAAAVAGKFVSEKKYGSAATLALFSVINIVMFSAFLIADAVVTAS